MDAELIQFGRITGWEFHRTMFGERLVTRNYALQIEAQNESATLEPLRRAFGETVVVYKFWCTFELLFCLSPVRKQFIVTTLCFVSFSLDGYANLELLLIARIIGERERD